jgi:hypothetical protein
MMLNYYNNGPAIVPAGILPSRSDNIVLALD